MRVSTRRADRTRSRQAGCTKQVLRVCLRLFRDGDCDPLPAPFRSQQAGGPRPRKSSRSFRRRLKGTARLWRRGWARGEATPTGINAGDTAPVGSVSTFRSADGQPADRKLAKAIVYVSVGRVTARSCNQTVEVGSCGAYVPHGIGVPQVALSCSTQAALLPSCLSSASALTARAGRVQLIVFLRERLEFP
jgi:hypothetical protein